MRAVADVLENFETWLPLENFDNAEWIRRQWVEMYLNKDATEVQEARKKGRRGNKWPVTNLGDRMGKQAWGNLPQLPNTISWLQFIECWMATMSRHPACNSKLRTQMWGTGRSWLISLNKMVAWNIQTVWLRYTNATWCIKNWTKSIWDYTHRGKRWMIVYMVRFHTTVPFQMPSSWNWDTMWNNFWYKWRQLEGKIVQST